MNYTLTTAGAELVQVYQRETTIEPFERIAVPFLDGIVEGARLGAKGGNEVQFLIRLADGYGIGAPNDGGDWAEARDPDAIKATVGKAQLDAALKITVEAEAAGEGEGSFTGDLLAEAVKACMRTYMYQKNIMALGHGTGRIAVVAADAVATDTVVFDGPEFCFQLRRNQFVEFANLDTGGTVQNLGGGVLAVKVTDIDFLTHTVTFDQNVTVSSGWGAYIAGTYGKRRMNGLRNIVDDGDLTSTVFGITRADHPAVNATVIDPGSLQDYSESLVYDALTQQSQKTDIAVTEAWMNEGIRSEHYRATLPDRQFMIQGGAADVPAYNSGANQGELAFHWNGAKIPYKCDRNMPAREMYFVYKEGFKRHVLIQDDWMRDGGAGGNAKLWMAPAAGGTTYSNTMIGSLQGNMNLSHNHTNVNLAIKNIRDRALARD